MEISTYLKQIAEIIKVYRTLLDKLGFAGSEPHLDKFITELIQDLNKPKSIDVDHLSDLSVVEVFKKYSWVMDVMKRIREVEDLFMKYQLSPTISSSVSISSSWADELDESLRNLNNAITSINNYFRELELDKIFADSITSREINHKYIGEITQIYLDYVKKGNGANVIDLYIKVLKDILDILVGKPGMRDTIKFVTDLLENVKDSILDTTSWENMNINLNKKNKTVNSVQFLLQSHYLTPKTDLSDIQEILKLIGINQKKVTNISSSLKSAAKSLSDAKKKYGFIMIYKINKNPIRHTIDPLVNMDFIHKHKLMQPAIAGINQTIIKRSRTIETIGPGDHADKIEIIDDMFRDDTDNYYYIIQSLNGRQFEILTPWGMSTRLDVDESYIDIREPVSTRVSKYNKILEDEIMTNLENPMIPVMGTSIELKLEESYWNGIRGTIKNSILSNFKDMLKQKNKGLSHSGIKDLIFSKPVIQNIIDEIASTAMEDMTSKMVKIPTDPIMLDQFKTDMNMSYIMELSVIKKKLYGRMMDIYSEDYEDLVSKMPKSTKLDLSGINKIIDIMRSILDDVLKIFINRKSGIFISIRSKLELLNKTLLAPLPE